LELLRPENCPFVIVLGHPEYYPRFGFERASLFGIRSQWAQVPDEAFMVLIIDKGVMAGISGTAQYRQEFDSAV
jgi:putative acetyltransferase